MRRCWVDNTWNRFFAGESKMITDTYYKHTEDKKKIPYTESRKCRKLWEFDNESKNRDLSD